MTSWGICKILNDSLPYDVTAPTGPSTIANMNHIAGAKFSRRLYWKILVSHTQFVPVQCSVILYGQNMQLVLFFKNILRSIEAIMLLMTFNARPVVTLPTETVMSSQLFPGFAVRFRITNPSLMFFGSVPVFFAQ